MGRGQVGDGDQLDSIAIDGVAHGRAGENFDFELRRGTRWNTANVGGGMEIQFGGAVAKQVDHANNIVLVEMPALMKSEQRVGRAEAALDHHAARPSRQGAENNRLDELARDIVTPEPQRRHHTLAREANAGDFVLDGEIDQDIGEQWMKVKIQMTVDVIEAADRFEMTLDLRAEFVGHFRAHRGIEKITYPREHGILEKAHGGIDSAAKLRRVEDATTAAYDGVPANAELGLLAAQV